MSEANDLIERMERETGQRIDSNDFGNTAVAGLFGALARAMGFRRTMPKRCLRTNMNNQPKEYNLELVEERRRLTCETKGYLRISRYWGMAINDDLFVLILAAAGMMQPMTPQLAARLLLYTNQPRFLTDGTDKDGREYAQRAIAQMAKQTAAQEESCDSND